MPRNMGTVDRVVRALVGIVLLGLVLLGYLGLPWNVVAAVVGIVFLVTSAVGFCPLYVPFKITTRRKAS
jgi:hypothetical protein